MEMENFQLQSVSNFISVGETHTKAEENNEPFVDLNVLNMEQKKIFDEVILSANLGLHHHNLHLIDGIAGTGKTFLYNVLISYCKQNQIGCVAVAYSGIAASLLINGRTCHSLFKLCLELNESSTCNVKSKSVDFEQIKNAKIIIWDEVSQSHNLAIKAVDRFLRDIHNSELMFGGVTVLFGGDHRQCLPVVKRGNRVDVVEATLRFTEYWEKLKFFRLTINMRTLPEEEKFRKWLLAIGNGDLEAVLIPSYCRVQKLEQLIDFTFPDFSSEAVYCSAILCAKNDQTFLINDLIIERLPGEEQVYLSVDKIVTGSEDDIRDIQVEVLNSFTPSGLPPYKLRLKKGCIVMLLRNLHVDEGLCNGTRLKVVNFSKNCLICEFIMGPRKGNMVFLPRIVLQSTDSEYPFIFSRKQFPVKVSFAMTINKSQGQTLDRVGLDLTDQVFSHGQLFVACSRVRTFSSLKIFSRFHLVKNVVFKEVLLANT